MHPFHAWSCYVALAMVTASAGARETFRDLIPNGDRVPNPCPGGGIWPGVGHQSPAGANARNPFGLDFYREGKRWTTSLCRKDSDGDGLTNGQELGDPECVWRQGATPKRTTGLSHPGICPLDSKTCVNEWTVCPKPFSCPALEESDVVSKSFTIKANTKVPASETTYICQAFHLSDTDTPVHMIGSKPIIVNEDILHHMIMYACKTRPKQSMFDKPEECFMSVDGCTNAINLWAYGVEGECFHKDAGFRIGGQHGYQYGVLQLHWNNPNLKSGMTDSSGFSLYYTKKLRRNDLGISVYGQLNLILPPGRQFIAFNQTCPSECTRTLHTKKRHITSAVIHMHKYAIQGRISLWRNGSLIKNLTRNIQYDYNSPQLYHFDKPVEYKPGDEVRTECVYRTTKTKKTIQYGEGTEDEMCFGFITYYPNDIHSKLDKCLAVSGINMCSVNLRHKKITSNPLKVQGCDIMNLLSSPAQVLKSMKSKNCSHQTGCNPECREYLVKTLWPSNPCYDPNRAKCLTEAMASEKMKNYLDPQAVQIIKNILKGQKYCEHETMGQQYCEYGTNKTLNERAEGQRTERERPDETSIASQWLAYPHYLIVGNALVMATLALAKGRL